MKLILSKRDKLILSAGILLLVLLVLFAQFFYLAPLKDNLANEQKTLSSEQKLLEAAGQKKAADDQQIVDDTRELQKKLPVKPLEDQFILDLEKAETVSSSSIKSMGFSSGTDVSTGNNSANGQNASGQQSSAAAQNGTNQGTANQNQSAQSTANQANQNQTTAAQSNQQVPAVTGVKKLTVNLTVESPDYEHFETFIQTLESLNRIVVVESINYSGGQEITSLEQQNQPLSFTLAVSAFYMPTLADLQAQLPKIDAPPPANKENPLSQFPDSTKSN